MPARKFCFLLELEFSSFVCCFTFIVIDVLVVFIVLISVLDVVYHFFLSMLSVGRFCTSSDD